MTTKEKIKKEIDRIPEEHLGQLLKIVRNFETQKRLTRKHRFLSKLKTLKIEAPEDFAKNIDQYLSGEKVVK